MSDFTWFLAWPLLAGFIALPAAAAWRRRRLSREVSAVALELSAFASASRAAVTLLPMDDALRLRLMRLRVAEAVALQLALELARGGPESIADAAQRLATRLRRRVAFERKMLARTAPGLRRGAVAASVPPLAVLLLHFFGWDIPAAAQVLLLLAVALGCALLWRMARVEI